MSRSIMLRCVALMLLLSVAGVCTAADETAPAVADNFTVTTEPESGRKVIVIPAENGRVPWSTVVRALARSAQLDDSALSKLPAEELDLTQPGARVALVAANLALPPEVEIKMVPGEKGAEPALRLTVDERKLKNRTRKIQREIRKRAGQGLDEYVLKLDDHWQERDPSRPVVLLVHGYNSTCSSLSGLQQEIIAREWPSATFDYPNDGPLDESAALLSTQLRKFGEQHPDRRIAIVAHSMGGLVARAVIEDPELDPGNVVQLITVGTPHHGSRLAMLPGGLECCDHLVNRRDTGFEGLVRVSVADGLNEAKYDLEPDSEFLTRLNARERNPRVRYSVLIGTEGPFTEAALTELRERLEAAGQQNEAVRLIIPKLKASLADLEELERGQGDGAVAVSRARLEGVEDTELLPFEHFTIHCKLDDAEARELTAAIFKRLESRN